MSKRRLAWQYSAYLVARAAPAALASRKRLLRHRFRYRIFWADPHLIVGKPGVDEGPVQPRHQEIALLERMTASFAIDGDWDLTPRPFGLHPIVRELFVEGLPPERTRTYAIMREAIAEGDALVARGCSSTDDLDRRFAEVRRTFEQMRVEGYRTQVRLGGPPGDEITLCVGRTGQPLLLRHGNHRLSMAKILDIPRVPVIVRGVHTGWVQALLAAGEPNAVTGITRALPVTLAGANA